VASSRVSVVIPARNESASIARVVAEAREHADEVIVVDDASRDLTAMRAEAAGARVVRNADRSGYIGSIKRGFREATGDVIVTLDADGEHRAEDIPLLVDPVVGGRADLVFAVRGTVPRPSERLINRLVRRRAGGIPDTGSGLRAIDRDLAQRLELRGRCTCGILALEAVALGATVKGVRSDTRHVRKPRRVAWGHLPQLFIVLGRMLRR
jgi:glycosyltransferase involved in cell wall biosynthesis